MPSSTGTLVFNDQKIQAPDIYATESLGVGVSDPTSNLEVVGNAYVSSNLEVGTANLFVDTQTGNVGIGEAVPSATLHIRDLSNNPATTASEAVTHATQRIQVQNSSSLSLYTGSVTGAVHQQVANFSGTSTYPLCLNPFGGNVGIGTASPATRLDVNGSASLQQPCVIAYPSVNKVYNTDGSNEDIIFGGTLLNRGSMYSTSTGIITIPEGGVYYFHMHMYMQPSHTGIFDLYKQPSGSTTWYRFTRGECNSACGDNTLVTLMSTQLCDTGDKFKYVKNSGCDLESIYYGNQSNYYQNMACYKVG
jgi:hypothetical protein